MMAAPPRRSLSDTLVFHRLNDLVCAWYIHTKRLPKLDRYTVGQRTFDLLLEMLVVIVRAQYAGEHTKKALLQTTVPHLDTVKVLIRLTHKLQIINEREYIRYEAACHEIGKMLGGWIRSLEKKPE
ncbi:four helix bundle protein [Candidatus Uhrbacteria bacterium]|nr:four helix bundle protein [Candidatus Uhrbacteria bacterium]